MQALADARASAVQQRKERRSQNKQQREAYRTRKDTIKN
jgi:hypothetical protein